MAQTKIRIPAHNWSPRAHQRPLWRHLERGGTRAIEIAHRRWGKDEICLHWGCVSAIQRVGNYHHALPEYAQARKAIWTAVNPHTGRRRIDEAFPQEIRANTNEQEMFIRFKNQSTWQVIGSDNYDRLVGSSIAGITFSEWALANPAAWAYISPIVAENKGWAVFITTPRGRNHAKTMYDMAKGDSSWYAQVSTVNDTHAIDYETIEQMRHEYVAMFGEEAGNALIEQELYCSFEAAILGAYYGKELSRAEQDGRIRPEIIAMDGAPVHTAWDLGVGDAMAIWFWQAVPSTKGTGAVAVLDYYESHGYGIAHYAEEIRRKRADHGWMIGTDFVPHDAKVREMTSSGHDGKAKQRVEVMIECGLKPKVIPQHKIMDGIQAVRQLLPRCSWHTRCNDGLERLRQYRAEWDDDRKTFRDIPCHDWTSHGADAVRTMAMAYREVVLREPPPQERRLQIAGGGRPHGQVTLNDLWALGKKPARRRI